MNEDDNAEGDEFVDSSGGEAQGGGDEGAIPYAPCPVQSIYRDRDRSPESKRTRIE